MSSLLDGLNDKQKEAALATEGPVLILAGAGSGKTKTLVHRIAHLIHEKGIPAYKVLAITFTNKAGKEIKERTERLLHAHQEGVPEYEPMIGTFHSTAMRWLKIEGHHLGFDSNFTILDASDQLAAVKRCMKELAIDVKKYSPKAVQHEISKAKNDLLSPVGFAALAQNDFMEVAAGIYTHYQKILTEGNMMDFDDLLLHCLTLFRDHPDVLKKYQDKYQYIMIDEYQDTNAVQYELVKLLASAHKNLCVIGDDWQGIYSWRGATIQNILDFENDYPEASIIRLEQNYRSTKTILSAAQAIIDTNVNRSEKVLWTDNEDGELISVDICSDQMQEAQRIVRDIESRMQEDRLGSGHLTYTDFAVLYRVNAQSRALEEAFVRSGIPYKLIGGTSFYERKEVKDVLAYLRLIVNPRDSISFARIVNVPPRRLGDKTIQTFMNYMEVNHLSLRDALENAHICMDFSALAHNAFANFSHIMRQLRSLADTHSAAEVLQETLKLTGYLSYIDDGTPESRERIENIRELESVAAKYQATDGSALALFLDEVALISDQDGVISDGSAVNLLTIHSSKGLEFNYVYLPGMEESIFPHQRSFLNTDEMEEERRLCYVALTRARRKVSLFACSSRMLFGDIQRNRLSRFVEELPRDVLDDFDPESHNAKPDFELNFGDRGNGLQSFKDRWREEQKKKKDALKLQFGSRYAAASQSSDTGFEPDVDYSNADTGGDFYPDADFSPSTLSKKIESSDELILGDRVAHTHYGEGEVTEINGDLITVRFGGIVGIKTLSLAVAPLEKLS